MPAPISSETKPAHTDDEDRGTRRRLSGEKKQKEGEKTIHEKKDTHEKQDMHEKQTMHEEKKEKGEEKVDKNDPRAFYECDPRTGEPFEDGAICMSRPPGIPIYSKKSKADFEKVQWYRDQIREIYKIHKPDSDIEKILEQYQGREEQMYESCVAAWGTPDKPKFYPPRAKERISYGKHKPPEPKNPPSAMRKVPAPPPKPKVPPKPWWPPPPPPPVNIHGTDDTHEKTAPAQEKQSSSLGARPKPSPQQAIHACMHAIHYNHRS